ncbi:coniferyl aldehyde dehydrogenase [Litorilituus lipolyticus]|uniref:Aldehyde dehydrogenase n=2 Tax=Litorilituus lipolyticus TaxID=2491017 RepID=A0A502KY88_9GAMM|nr:coniferyl aldehyde dehydrogenase [Litorilituus lipolyticus]
MMADNSYTPADENQQISNINDFFASQRLAFKKQSYLSLSERIEDLQLLKSAIKQHKEPLITALSQDFSGRSAGDSKMADIMPTIMGIDYTIKHLKKWMKPEKRHVSALFQPAKAFVVYQPLGVVGIITPWNYPVFLSLGPLTTALAAGNRAMIKMSEFTPATNEVIKSMLLTVFSQNKVAVITGGVESASYFSEQAFDHLLFTGSTQVGKKVMASAAKNLTPVTLELGGKSPVIIDDEIDIKLAVSRILLGKTLNAGQTCVAPDYVLCPEGKVTELLSELKLQFNSMYPSFAENDDYTSIINQAQFDRLQQGVIDAVDKGADVTALVTDTDAFSGTRKMPLTVVTQVNDDMLLMQEEIFGPVLPIVSYKTFEQALSYVNDRPRPLALYLCSFDEGKKQQVLDGTHAGGVCINDAAVHVAQDDLPFGGIGPSGMGQYHGHEGFLTFSKAKPVFEKGKFNTAKMAYPPYGKWIHRMMDKIFLS